jgi:hypothetical protein
MNAIFETVALFPSLPNFEWITWLSVWFCLASLDSVFSEKCVAYLTYVVTGDQQFHSAKSGSASVYQGVYPAQVP